MSQTPSSSSIFGEMGAAAAAAAAPPSVDHSHHSTGSTGSSGIIGGTPFFADAILDLDTAHDLAETPEINKPIMSSSFAKNTARGAASSSSSDNPTARRLEMPSLALESTPENEENGNNKAAAASPQRGAQAGGGGGGDNDRQEKSSFTRITSLETSATSPTRTPTSSSALALTSSASSEAAVVNSSSISSTPAGSRRRPSWPRDLTWAVAFFLIVPTSLIWPILVEQHDEDASPLIHAPLSTGTAHALLWAAVFAILGSRFLYRTPSGPQGDDARHAIGQALTGMAALSLAIYVVLGLSILWWLPNAKIAVLIPLWYTVRDFYLVRRWQRYNQQAGGSSSDSSRHAFFQALSGMALDILSRSLRRVAFFRVLSSVLFAQTVLLFVWRWALLGALGSGSLWMVVFAALGGKWATGTVARLLSLIASGGVENWFIEQSGNLPPTAPPTSTFADRENEDENDDETGNMPDAYRTVDASVYQTVLNMDDVLDDDDDDDDEDMSGNVEDNDDEFMEAPSRREHNRRRAEQQQQHQQQQSQRLTVKSLLEAGLTVSFGSVAQCGLLGGLAQFILSQLRKVDAAQSAWALARANIASAAANRNQRRNNGSNNNDNNNGFSSMPVGDSSGGASGGTLLQRFWHRFNQVAREFARNHSDLAMSHVAVYYKSYQRAARDVATLVDDTGVEPILHDDITTHMCASVGGALSGIVVIFTGYVLLKQREKMGSENTISDLQVAENMILAFILCYTLIFTVMEPLRAGIKAVYVSFAQHPRSLSQAYPLIYHRLSRLSASNIR